MISVFPAFSRENGFLPKHTIAFLLDVPKLPPLPGAHENENDQPDEEESKSEDKPERVRKTSGPKATDPYASDESGLLLPVLIALGVFIPTLFCLCKL